eukprot:2693508-Pleurochrysis_carterae.AAC.2
MSIVTSSAPRVRILDASLECARASPQRQSALAAARPRHAPAGPTRSSPSTGCPSCSGRRCAPWVGASASHGRGAAPRALCAGAAAPCEGRRVLWARRRAPNLYREGIVAFHRSPKGLATDEPQLQSPPRGVALSA